MPRPINLPSTVSCNSRPSTDFLVPRGSFVAAKQKPNSVNGLLGQSHSKTHLALPQLHLPFLFDAEVGPEELDNLAGAVTAGLIEIAIGPSDAHSAAPNATE